MHVHVIGKGRRGLALVKEALTTARQMELTFKKLSGTGTRDQVWCVFDRDDSLSQEVIEAIAEADKSSIRVAYSDECFEFWLLLHFCYNESRIPRNELPIKLTTHISRCLDNEALVYSKTLDDTTLGLLFEKLELAIKNAERLLEKYQTRESDSFPEIRYPVSPDDASPVTTVHLLVKELSKLREDA